MGTGCLLHLGVERTEGSSSSFPRPGPALPPRTPSLHSWSSLLSACGQTHPSYRPRSQQEPSRACTLDLGLLCHSPPTWPFPPLVSGFWQKVDWKLEGTSFDLSSHRWALPSCRHTARGQGASDLTTPPCTLWKPMRQFRVTGQWGRSGARLLGFIIQMSLSLPVCKMWITVSTIRGVGVKIK